MVAKIILYRSSVEDLYTSVNKLTLIKLTLHCSEKAAVLRDQNIEALSLIFSITIYILL